MTTYRRKPAPLPSGLASGLLALELDSSLYEVEAIFRACFRFTDSCFFYLCRCEEDPRLVVVTLGERRAGMDLEAIAADLLNEVIDQQLRCQLERDTAPIREMIVAQAFAEGNLLDGDRDEGDYEADPLGIGHSR